MLNKAFPILTILGFAFAGSALASEELAKSKNCLVCHQIDAKRVGPSYKDVAQKYAGQAEAETMLINKVMKGGGGNWGGMPMPANPQVSPEEAKTLVQWILGLK